MRVCKKIYRVQHQRCVGTQDMVLLQNRVVEAESAEQALRLAMHMYGDEPCDIDNRGTDLAMADRSNPAKWFDFWKAELEQFFMSSVESDVVAS